MATKIVGGKNFVRLNSDPYFENELHPKRAILAGFTYVYNTADKGTAYYLIKNCTHSTIPSFLGVQHGGGLLHVDPVVHTLLGPTKSPVIHRSHC